MLSYAIRTYLLTYLLPYIIVCMFKLYKISYLCYYRKDNPTAERYLCKVYKLTDLLLECYTDVADLLK